MTIQEQIDSKIDEHILLSEKLENDEIDNEEYQSLLSILESELQSLNESLDVQLTDTKAVQKTEIQRHVDERKQKLAYLVSAMEMNPMINNETEGLPMLSFFSSELESYKYSDLGKEKFINALENHNGIYKDLLERIVSLPNTKYPNGMTTLNAINEYL